MGGNFSTLDEDYQIKASSSDLPLPPLKFHDVYSSGVMVSPNKLVMRRMDQGWGLTFSNRPLDIDEIICLKIVMFHKGLLRFGLTSQDPALLDPHRLETFTYDSADRTIIKELSTSCTHKDTFVFLKLNAAGQVVYGWQRNDKSKDKGVLFGGVTLHLPVWAVFEVSGKNLAIRLEENIPLLRTKSFKKSTHLKKAKSVEFSDDFFNTDPAYNIETENDTHPTDRTRTQSYGELPRAKSFSIPYPAYVPLEVSDVTNPNTTGNVKNTSNLFNIPLSNIDFEPGELPTFTTNSEKAKRRLSDKLSVNEEHRTSMCFHCVVGKNINLSSEQMIATRTADNCNGYVFTRRPLELNEKVTIKLLQINPLLGGSLGFGLTVCDPSDVSQFPDDADNLLDRQEYWVVIKNLCKNPAVDDELGFLLTKKGEVVMFKNNSCLKTIVHVDPTLSLWIFFDLCGCVEKISSLGSIIYKSIPKDLFDKKLQSSKRQSCRNKQTTTKPTTPSSSASLTLPKTSNLMQDGPSEVLLQNLESSSSTISFLTPPSTPSLTTTSTATPAATTSATPSTSYNSKRSKSLNAEVANLHHQQILGSPLLGKFDIFNDIPGSLAPPLIPVPRNPIPNRSNIRPAVPARPPSLTSNRCKREQLTSPSTQSRPTTSQTLKTEEVERLLNEISLLGNQKTRRNDPKESTSESECTVCFDNAPNCVLYTCGHICVCYDCGQSIMKSQKPFCPICRKNIVDVIKIYKS